MKYRAHIKLQCRSQGAERVTGLQLVGEVQGAERVSGQRIGCRAFIRASYRVQSELLGAERVTG